ncbi:MAG TPA: energy transducer TonB [Candidatus Bathyarchaeia archaeon]|nr:energy transducer TonB [Candidatus Bathyarchaeia archaeon]
MSTFALQHRSPRPPLHSVTEGAILPTLFCEGHEIYGTRRGSIVVSFLGHTLPIMLLLAADKVVVPRYHEIRQQVVPLVTEVSPYILPPSASKAGGGGGGGDRDKLQASKGILPRFSREQLAPPAVIVRNENPKLAVEPTVAVPPEIHLSMPQTGPLGDPLSSILGPPSSGTGSGGGIGSGSGGGVGSGHGPGVGPGWGGGMGGGAYRVGGGVTAPRVIYSPDPVFSEEARKAKFQGTVVLWLIVGVDGRTRDIRIQRSLGMGLDENAIDAIRRWRFDPGRKDGVPVAVQVNIEVNFQLY